MSKFLKEVSSLTSSGERKIAKAKQLAREEEKLREREYALYLKKKFPADMKRVRAEIKEAAESGERKAQISDLYANEDRVIEALTKEGFKAARHGFTIQGGDEAGRECYWLEVSW